MRVRQFTFISLVSIITIYLLLGVMTVNAQDKPLTLAQILTGLQTQGKTSETSTLDARLKFIKQRVTEVGIAFELTADREKDLRDAGANDDLIAVIKILSDKNKKASQTVKPMTTNQTDKPVDTNQTDNPSDTSKTVADDYFDRGIKCEAQKKECNIFNYSKAIELNPNFMAAYFKRGAAFSLKCGTSADNPGAITGEEMNFCLKAIADYSKLVELKPRDPNPYRSRAALYRRIGENEKARADELKLLNLPRRRANRN